MYQALLVVLCAVSSVFGHGRVLEPPSRATAWRYGFPTAKNYDDNGSNCGGREYQWAANGGKCGICGDPYNMEPPRPHEYGGEYGQGVIVKNYTSSLIDITVELTTSHKGFWEFKICDDVTRNGQECFDQFPLQLQNGGTRYYPSRGDGKYTVTYRLPSGLVCDHCVLQWKYIAGNNMGVCGNGTQSAACAYQEQFGACSDISIRKPGLKRFEDNAVRDYEKKPRKPYPLTRNRYFNTQLHAKELSQLGNM